MISRIFIFTLMLCSLSDPLTLAQDPIRIETNEVLLPTIVYDRERIRLLRNDTGRLWQAYSAGEMGLVDDIVEGLVIPGLGRNDFHVIEDGKEQTIRNVAYERSLYWDVRDNTGHHTEYIGPGGGKWSSGEWPPNVAAELEPPHYLIAFVPPESAEGSCHQIQVKVNRPNAMVLARSEYCNSKHSASDPLNGTMLGKQLEDDLTSAKSSEVNSSLLAVSFFTEGEGARVHVSVDWPSNSLKRSSRTVGVLGKVFKKDGSLVTRFSDVFESVEPSHVFNGVNSAPHINEALTRYETQLVLPPAEYLVRVVFGDGTKFGRDQVDFPVYTHAKKELDISQVSLCKQIDDVSPYSPQNKPKLPGAWGQKLPGDYRPLVSRDVEFKPTGNTRFKKASTLYTYFEIYEPSSVEGQSSAIVQFQMRIVDSKTGEVISDSQPISAAPYKKTGSSIIPVGRGLDISKLPKGSYRLDVQATDSTGKSTPWRTANFTVE